MEKELRKILYKVLPFVLCICIVSGAAAPAYATSTTSDGSAHNLWDLYWTTSSNPSGKNGSWYGVVRILLKDIFDKIELLQTDQRNLWTYNSTSYRLKNFTDTTSLSESYYISSGAYPMSWLLNSMANLSQNTGYTANQFYNSNSNLNKAMSAMVSLNQYFQDYTTVLNNIKSNTDNLSGIKTDTDNLSGIKTDTDNLSGIKTDTANLSGIKTDTYNLFGIKTDTANLSGIKTDTANLSGIKTDIESFNDDYNDISWSDAGVYLGAKSNLDGEYITSQIFEHDAYFLAQLNAGFQIYDLFIPVRSTTASNMIAIYELETYLIRSTTPLKLSDFDYQINVANNGTHIIIYLPVDNGNTRTLAFKLICDYTKYDEYSINPNSYSGYVKGIAYDKKDFYDVASWLDDKNILKLFKQAKEMFFDDETLAAKKANQDQEDSVLTNFTGSGAASASVSDFGAVKDSMVSFKAGFSGGASSSDTFGFLSGDSNAWNWFTQDTANDLDRTQGNNTRLLRSSSYVASDTPLLDSYYTSILSILGGDE